MTFIIFYLVHFSIICLSSPFFAIEAFIQSHKEDVWNDESSTGCSNLEQINYQANEDVVSENSVKLNREVISTEATIHIPCSNDR